MTGLKKIDLNANTEAFLKPMPVQKQFSIFLGLCFTQQKENQKWRIRSFSNEITQLT